MKLIYNNIIPTKGFVAVNLFGVLFVRKGKKINPFILNHESIHTRQMQEMLFVFFYFFYVFEWMIKCVYYRNSLIAYRSLSFEREAYRYERDLNYLKRRKLFSWVRFIWVR